MSLRREVRTTKLLAALSLAVAFCLFIPSGTFNNAARANQQAMASTVTQPFTVSVKASNYSKHGASGILVRQIRIEGAGLLTGRPKVTCNPRFCGHLGKSKKRPRRSRLHRRSVTFSNVNWVLASGHGFTVTVIPDRKKVLGAYAKLAPPDAYNASFTIIASGCTSRSGHVVACPSGTQLPVVTHRGAPSAPATPVPVTPYPGGGDLGVASIGEGKLTLFTTGSDGQLWYRNYVDGVGWDEWKNLGGNIQDAPAAVRSGPGRLDVFARGADNALHHLYFTQSAGWSAWESLGGTLTSAPAASSWGTGRMDVFMRGIGNTLLHTSKNPDSGWAVWESLGETISSAPTAAACGGGIVHVFMRGIFNAAVQKFTDDSGVSWQPPAAFDLGGILGAAPAAVAVDCSHISLFVPSSNNTLYRKRWNSPSWDTAWEPVSGTTLNYSLSAATWKNGAIDVFSRDVNGVIVHWSWANNFASSAQPVQTLWK